MKTSELRSGNLVTIDNPQSWPDLKDIPMIVFGTENWMSAQEKITWPQSDGKVKVKSKYETYGQFSEFIKPIPLTEEWLLKFGFKKDNPDYFYYYKGNFKINVFNAVAYKLNLDFKTVFTAFKYVHELQNLYFALKGEELTLNN